MRITKKLTAILLSFVMLLSAMSITAYADDNVTGGGGSTSDAEDGYAWYNTPEYLWKVSLYVGKRDNVNKTSSLVNDYYLVGNTSIYMRRSGWTLASNTQFAQYNKPKYYAGQGLAKNSLPQIITDSRVPAVPIACGGNIPAVKSYFGDTNTLNLVLNKLAQVKGTTKDGLVSGLNFTLAGITQKWSSSYILPNSSGSNQRVPWVIIYEPVVVMHLKDNVNRLAFTATEYAKAQLAGWYNFTFSGTNPQKVEKLTHKHLPTSVQLEENWFGYPVYAVTNDNQRWTENNIIKGGGWGMRYLNATNIQPAKDFGVTINSANTPMENTSATVSVTWRNYKDYAFNNVPCTLYLDGTQVWSGNLNFKSYESKTQTFTVAYGWGTQTRKLKAQINWSARGSETNSANNEAVRNVTPKAYLDFSIQNLTVQPNPQYEGEISTVKCRVDNWNKNSAFNNIPVELVYHGKVVETQYVNFSAYGTNYLTFSLNTGKNTSQNDVTVRINWAQRSAEVRPENNSETQSLTLNTYYDFSVSELSVSESTIFENHELTVTCRTDNWDKVNSYTRVPVELMYRGRVIATEYVDYGPYAVKRHTFKINVGSILGFNNVMVRVNWNNVDKEMDKSNNVDMFSIKVKEALDFRVEIIQPNAGYREGMEVVTSCLVHNDSTHPIDQSRSLSVNLKGTYTSGGVTKTILNQDKTLVVIPAGTYNLIWFKWKVPVNMPDSIQLTATVNPTHNLEETNYNNNTGTRSIPILSNDLSITPNPSFSLTRPAGWTHLDTPTTKSSTPTMTWSFWDYTDGKFVRRNHDAGITSFKVYIRPDVSALSSSIQTNDDWEMKSGYGIKIEFTPRLDGNYLYNQVALNQWAEAYIPEFGYSTAFGKYRSLQYEGAGFQFPKNTDAEDGGRKHFIPMWYKDGPYKIQVKVTDIWTPGGMLSRVAESNTIKINGSMYDDYYSRR